MMVQLALCVAPVVLLIRNQVMELKEAIILLTHGLVARTFSWCFLKLLHYYILKLFNIKDVLPYLT